MAQKWTHAACFEFFGTKPKNPRWSWSGRSDDGQIVSVTLWQDYFTDRARRYRVSEGAFGTEWKSNPGYAELIENLRHARDHLEGVVRVVVAVAADVHAHPRKIASCHPQKDLRMRVTELDLNVGTFTLERVEP